MQQLIDGDLASNNGGWQWSASTGVDPCPYFRIFNPYTQSLKVSEIVPSSENKHERILGRSKRELHQVLGPRASRGEG